jgi:WD40 repeat protein
MQALTGARPAILLAAMCALGGACKKEKQFLVLASLTTPTTMTGLSSVTIGVAGTKQTFPITQLSPTAVTYGVYVPDDVGSSVTVQASAKVGTSCVGLAGSGAATIAVDTGSVDITLTAANTCGEPPPSLARCQEYDHNATSTACYSAYEDGVFIRSIAFSPNGHYLATAGSDGRVKIWTFDGKSLAPEGTVLQKDGTAEVAFSPDGKLLAVGCIPSRDPLYPSLPGTPLPIDLYDVGSWTRRRMLTGISSDVAGVAFSPDGRYVIALESDNYGAGDLLALPVDGSSPQPALPLTIPPWWLAVASTASGGSVAVAVASRIDQVALLSFSDGQFTAPTLFSATGDPSVDVWAIGFSPDASFLAAGGDDNVFQYWNVPFQSATPASTPFNVGKSLTTLAFSPDNDYVAVAAGGGYEAGELTVWDLLTHTVRGNFTPTYVPFAIAYAPSGKAIAGGEDDCGKVFLCAD